MCRGVLAASARIGHYTGMDIVIAPALPVRVIARNEEQRLHRPGGRG